MHLEVIEKFDEFGTIWFRDHARHVRRDDREDIIGAARLILANQRHDVSRSAINTFCQRSIQWAYRAHIAEERKAKLVRQEAQRSYRFKHRMGKSLFEAMGGVSTGGHEGFGDIFEDLRTPPYRVEWGDSFQPSVYLNDPYHVPGFKIVPVQSEFPALRLLTNGKNRAVDGSQLSEVTLLTLELLRDRYAAAVATMVREYLRDYGWRTVPREHKGVIARFNKGMKPKQIQTELKIKESTYWSHMKALERRGWKREWIEKKRRWILIYQPLYDNDRKLHENGVFAKVDGLSIRERIEVTGNVPPADVLMGEIEDDAVGRYLADLERQLEDTKLTAENVFGYDERLRAFVERLVRRPIVTQAISFEHAMSLLIDLPQERQKEVLFSAIRLNKSIADMFGLADFFPESYREKERETYVLDLKAMAS